MVTLDGTAKVLDFGLTKSVVIRGEANSEETTLVVTPLTSAGVSMGTPPYMSPEQVRGEVVDKRTDIWAFGCLLYRQPPRGGWAVLNFASSMDCSCAEPSAMR